MVRLLDKQRTVFTVRAKQRPALARRSRAELCECSTFAKSSNRLCQRKSPIETCDLTPACFRKIVAAEAPLTVARA